MNANLDDFVSFSAMDTAVSNDSKYLLVATGNVSCVVFRGLTVYRQVSVDHVFVGSLYASAELLRHSVKRTRAGPRLPRPVRLVFRQLKGLLGLPFSREVLLCHRARQEHLCVRHCDGEARRDS